LPNQNKAILIVFLSALLCASAGAVSVKVSSPVNGSTVGSPVKVAASASSANRITGWYIYVDNATVYHSGGYPSIAPLIALPSGKHSVTVRAWDSTGHYASAYLTLDVAVSAVSIAISPTTVSLLTGQTKQFTASVAGTTNTGVTWSVNGVQGGNSTVGTISASGLYSAPGTALSSPASVAARSIADSTKSALASVTVSSGSTSGPTPPPQAAGYHLAFGDEFDTLNLSPTSYGNYKWYNPAMWWHNSAPYANIWAANGEANLLWTRGQSPADTGISTAAKDGSYYKAFRYGYFESRFRWDTVTGSWPAFWMIPVQNIFNKDRNSSGIKDSVEVDIMEAQGASPHEVDVHVHEWKGDVAGGPATHDVGPAGFGYNTQADLSQYHKYGVLWVPGRLTFYFDDQPIYSVATPAIMDQQDYILILGSQEGANWSYGNLNGVTANMIAVKADWVRVWQK
jgi:glycosyl hydrolase family 16/Big-like domain-containing protein